MKMLLIDVEKCEVRTVEAGSLEEYYELLNCDCVDIVSRTIAGKRFEIICDDEAFLKAPLKISAVDRRGEPMLGGNLLIAGGEIVDEDLTGLTDREIRHIIKNHALATSKVFPEPYPIVINMDY